MRYLLTLIVTIQLLFNLNVMAGKTIQGTETPDYKVIKKLDKLEIREYPGMVTASTIMGSSYSDNSGNGFRTVAGYIFGSNERNEKISMTSPVIVEMSDTMKMRFIMPSGYAINDLPAPKNSNVTLETLEQRIMAAITYSGYNSDNKMQKYKQMLIDELNENNIEVIGDFMFLGYNPPYRFVNRRNEIVVEVEWK